jgi:hypothetical protein
MADLVGIEALDRQKVLLPVGHAASLQEGGWCVNSPRQNSV